MAGLDSQQKEKCNISFHPAKPKMKTKSETRITDSVLKQDPRNVSVKGIEYSLHHTYYTSLSCQHCHASILPSTGQENNTAQPKIR